MSTFKRPAALTEGSLVQIVSPSSYIADPSIVSQASHTLQSWGLRVRVSDHALCRDGHFAGSDDLRSADFNQALSDPEVRCILCSRGGYGALRLLPLINFQALSQDPKWLVGFSDVTALHSSSSRLCSVQSLHAPMAKALAHSHSQKSTLSAMRAILSGSAMPAYEVGPCPLNRPGSAQGRLCGGNLSLIYSLLATPFMFDLSGAVLFIEDLCEKQYHIDRMMQALRLSGALSRISGLVVGTFSDVPADPEFGMSVQESILRACSGFSFPVCFGFPVGHEGRNVPLVQGAEVRLSVSLQGACLQEVG